MNVTNRVFSASRVRASLMVLPQARRGALRAVSLLRPVVQSRGGVEGDVGLPVPLTVVDVWPMVPAVRAGGSRGRGDGSRGRAGLIPADDRPRAVRTAPSRTNPDTRR